MRAAGTGLSRLGLGEWFLRQLDHGPSKPAVRRRTDRRQRHEQQADRTPGYAQDAARLPPAPAACSSSPGHGGGGLGVGAATGGTGDARRWCCWAERLHGRQVEAPRAPARPRSVAGAGRPRRSVAAILQLPWRGASPALVWSTILCMLCPAGTVGAVTAPDRAGATTPKGGSRADGPFAVSACRRSLKLEAAVTQPGFVWVHLFSNLQQAHPDALGGVRLHLALPACPLVCCMARSTRSPSPHPVLHSELARTTSPP